ncbi:unnamed protein product [Allacma fusca]|uniref:Uncharacterized protein n=1 Tax=Allacma fusca TaxID=39272 RepID=A0A8J2PAH3_9HEXA|nr:unnamed protein product [Allacma fusca]
MAYPGISALGLLKATVKIVLKQTSLLGGFIGITEVYKSLMTTKKVLALLGFAWIGPISAIFFYFGFGTTAGGEILHVPSYYEASTKNASQFQRNLKYLKRTSHGILVGYLIGWGPYCLAYGISDYDGSNVSSEAMLIFMLVARSLFILKSLTSSTLYAMRFRVIRRALLDMSFGCKCLDNGDTMRRN